MSAYKHDNDVNLIIRQTSPAELKNASDKEKFNKVIKTAALGLFKNYKSSKP